MALGYCFLSLRRAVLNKLIIRQCCTNGRLFAKILKSTEVNYFYWTLCILIILTLAEDQITHAIRVLRILESVADIISPSAATTAAGKKLRIFLSFFLEFSLSLSLSLHLPCCSALINAFRGYLQKTVHFFIPPCISTVLHFCTWPNGR
jgi:hypothetical protein